MKSSTKYLKITLNIFSIAVMLFFFVVILPKFISYFMPFVVAALIAFMANPFVKFLEKKVKIVRKAGGAFVIIVAIGLVVFLLYFLIVKLVEELIGFASVLPSIWQKTSTSIKNLVSAYDNYFSGLPIPVQNFVEKMSMSSEDSLENWLGGFSESIGQIATNIATNIPLAIVSILMGILASYFFLADKDYILSVINTIFPQHTVKRFNMVYEMMKTAVGGYFKAQLKIMIVVYVVLLAGLLILGRNYAFLIALFIALLDFFPFFGTGTVMWPWAIVAFLQADYKLAIGLAVVWAVSQLVRQLIQPKLLGDSIGMKPIPTIILLFVGFKSFGAIGLILAVPIGMIVMNLYKAGVFSNFIYSIRIMTKDIAVLRKFSKKELLLEGVLESSKIPMEEDENTSGGGAE